MVASEIGSAACLSRTQFKSSALLAVSHGLTDRLAIARLARPHACRLANRQDGPRNLVRRYANGAPIQIRIRTRLVRSKMVSLPDSPVCLVLTELSATVLIA